MKRLAHATLAQRRLTEANRLCSTSAYVVTQKPTKSALCRGQRQVATPLKVDGVGACSLKHSYSPSSTTTTQCRTYSSHEASQKRQSSNSKNKTRANHKDAQPYQHSASTYPSTKLAVGVRLSPQAFAAVTSVIESALGARSEREVLREVAVLNGDPSAHAVILEEAKKMLQLAKLSAECLEQQYTALAEGKSASTQMIGVESSSNFDQQASTTNTSRQLTADGTTAGATSVVEQALLNYNNAASRFVSKSVDAIIAAPTVSLLKNVLREIIGRSRERNKDTEKGDNTASSYDVLQNPLAPEHYMAAFTSLSTLEASAVGGTAEETSDLGYHLIADACRNNCDTLAVWESFFAMMAMQRQSSLRVDLWEQRYRERVEEKIAAMQKNAIREDLFGSPESLSLGVKTEKEIGFASSAFSGVDELDLDAALFPEFDEETARQKILSSSNSNASSSSSEKHELGTTAQSDSNGTVSDPAVIAAAKHLLVQNNKMYSSPALSEPQPQLIDDRSTVPLAPSIAKILINAHATNHNLHAGLRILNLVTKSSERAASERHRLVGRAELSRVPYSLGGGGSTSSTLENDRAETYTPTITYQDRIEMLTTLCYHNRFVNSPMSADGGFKRGALRTITGKEEAEAFERELLELQRTLQSIGGENEEKGNFANTPPTAETQREVDHMKEIMISQRAMKTGADSRRTAALLSMPWSRIVHLLPSLTIESALTVVQLKSAFVEGAERRRRLADVETEKGPTRTASIPPPFVSSSATTIPLFVWEAVFRMMCRRGRIEESEMLYRQLLSLHVKNTRDISRELNETVSNVQKKLAATINGASRGKNAFSTPSSASASASTPNGSENDCRGLDTVAEAVHTAAVTFSIFEKTVHNDFSMVTLLSSYLSAAYNHTEAYAKGDADIASLVGFIVPHHEKALEELSDVAVEAHTNYLTTIVQVEQQQQHQRGDVDGVGANIRNCSPSEIPRLDLNVAFNQIGEITFNLYAAKRHSAIKRIFPQLLEAADSENTKAMLFFEMADRGLINLSKTSFKKRGKHDRERSKSSTSHTATYVNKSRSATPVEVSSGDTAEEAVRTLFAQLFGSHEKIRSLRRQLPEVDDFSGLDDQMMVPVELDAELRGEEGSAMRSEYEQTIEEETERTKAKREAESAAKGKAYEEFLSKAVHDVKKEVRNAKSLRVSASPRGKNGYFSDENSRGGKTRQTKNTSRRFSREGGGVSLERMSSSTRWSERHKNSQSTRK